MDITSVLSGRILIDGTIAMIKMLINAMKRFRCLKKLICYFMKESID